MNERLVIRDFGPADSVSQLTVLLHAAYAALASQGFRYMASHQDDAKTRERLAAGFPVVAELDGSIVATVTLYGTLAASINPWYTRKGVFRFGQFAVRPDLQKRGIGLRLLQFIERRARERGAEELALDTAEGASHLRVWYEKLGFRQVGWISWPDTNYRSVVLSKRLAGNLPVSE